MDLVWQDLERAKSELRDKVKAEIAGPIPSEEIEGHLKILSWKQRNFIDRTDFSHICNRDCFEYHTDLIYGKLNLYGCKIGGIIHACNKKLSQNFISSENIITDCKYVYTGEEGLKNCCISSFVTGISIYDQRYGKVSKSKDDDKIPSNYDVVDDDSLLFCRTVELCKISDLDGEYEIKASKRTKKRKYDADNEQINSDYITCSGVITDLLFNKSIRGDIDSRHYSESLKQTTQKMKRYIKKECYDKGLLPNYNHLRRLYDFYMNGKTRIMSMQMDHKIVQYYTGIVMKIWELIYAEIYNSGNSENSFARFQFRQFVIGLLYMLTIGINVREYFPKNAGENSQQSSPTGSLSGSTDSMRSRKDIVVQTLDDMSNKINVISFGSESDEDESDEEESEEDAFEVNKIQLLEPDPYLTIHLPPEQIIKDITCSIANKKSYSKQDITKGDKWIRTELRKIKNMDRVKETKLWLDEYIKEHSKLIDWDPK
jgi:hypothetical protein